MLAWLADRLPNAAGSLPAAGGSIALDRLEVIRDPHWDGFSLDSGPDVSGVIWRTTPPVGGRPSRPPGPRIPRRGPGWPIPSQGPPGIARDLVGVLPGPDRHDAALRRHRSVRRTLGRPHRSRPGVVVDLDGGNVDADYRLTLDGRWLDGVVTGRTRWGRNSCCRCGSSPAGNRIATTTTWSGCWKHADRAALRAVERFEGGA